jgi:hypothetical protein
MKRRAFLAGFLAAPWLVREAFGDASISGPARVTATEPTLVLVVPKDERTRWDRGAAFGELLNHGSDRDLAPLATVDVMCARASQLGAKGDPLMLYVEGGRVWQLNGVLPQYHQYGRGRRDLDPDEAAVAQERIELLSTLIREVLPRPRLPIAQAAARARARWVQHAPSGSRWGHADGCGTWYEGEDKSDAPDCGMGHVPAASARFLDFLVKQS